MARVRKSTSRVFSAAETAACRAWQAPVVVDHAAPRSEDAVPAPAVPQLPPEELESIRRRAREEGLEAGRCEGREQGRAEMAAQAARLRAVLDALEAPLRELDDGVVEALTELALTIARHLVRREIHAEPGEIVAVVRQAAAELPVAARRVRVVLAPADASIVRAALGAGEGGEARWEIVEDPSVQRGGCRIESEHSRIDATVERRLAAIAAQILGGERECDDGPGSR